MKKKFLIALAVLSVTYFALLTKGSFTRYDFYEQEGDLPAYDNTIYNTSQGRMMVSTMSGSVMSFWASVNAEVPPYPRVHDRFHAVGIHSNWALALTNAPITAIFTHPKTTLVMQTLYIALTGFFMGLLFFAWGLPAWAALSFVAAFFIHPATLGANLNAFHPVVMAMPFLVLFLLGLEWRKTWLTVLSSVLICLTQENAILTAMALSVFPAMKKRYRFAAIHFIATSIFFVLTTKKIIPHYNEAGVLPYGHLYGSPLGASMEEIVKNGLLHPLLLLKTIFTEDKISWLLMQVLGFFTMLFSPALFMVGLVGLMPNLLSTNATMLLFWGQYNALGFPIFVLGAAHGLAWLQSKKGFVEKKGVWITAIIAPLFSIAVYLHIMPGAGAMRPESWLFRSADDCTRIEQCRAFREVEALIPSNPDISVSGPEHLMSHLDQRKRSYFFPVEMRFTDISIVERYEPWWWPKGKVMHFDQQLLESGYTKKFENSQLSVYVRDPKIELNQK